MAMSLRKGLPIVQSLIFLVVLCLFGLGLYGYLYRHDTNFCEMTYMFENPTYNRIAMSDEVEQQYPRYGLYSYCEGRLCEAHRKHRFSGAPVLFIVGNADSYRQVRSLGSVAYRMSDEKKPLDFFSVDFNEELSALFGSVLEQQTEFVAHAIERILRFYPANRKIILVGNSIGGLLSRAVFLKNFDAKLVRLIITQATPHQAPVIQSDSYVSNFYARVNHHWQKEWNNSLQHLVLLSLAGGDRDHLVRSDLCSLDGLTDESRSIDVLTSAVPHVWTSTDHRCVVWCRQLVLATTRALLEIIDEKNAQPQAVMKILKRHFAPTVDFNLGSNTTLTGDREPTIITQPATSIQRQPAGDYLISVKNTPFHTVVLHVTNARVYLKDGKNLLDLTRTLQPIPPTYGNRKMIEFNLAMLNDRYPSYDSILVRTENTKSQVDIYQIQNGEQVVELSTFGSRKLTFQQTGYAKLVFPTLTRLWQVYTVRLVSSNLRTPLLHFHVPWSNEDLYNLVSFRDPSSPLTVLAKSLERQMRLKLHRPRPDSSDHPSLELFLDPTSSYTLHIDFSLLDLLAQLVRYYIFLLPTFLFTVLCISFALQIENTSLRTFQTMLAWQVHLPVSIGLTCLYKLVIVCFPFVNDHANGYYFFLLPFVLYFLALSLWALIAFVVDYLIFDFIRPMLFPLFTHLSQELNQYVKLSRAVQWVLLALPMLSATLFSGSYGHIGLFFLAVLHTLWRGTINRRLRDILTTLLLFHGLLVVLNLTGFIIHVRSVLIHGPLPLYLIMPDPSLLSAVCCILAFYGRFLFDRNQSRSLSALKSLVQKQSRTILIVLAIVSQLYCSYAMYRLWMLISFVFIHAAMIFFVPTHQA